MKKSDLPTEHVEKINFAVENGLCSKSWEPISLLSGGLTGVPVYRITAEGKSYAIKLEDVNDRDFDLTRSYKIMEMVSKRRISPLVYFTNAAKGIILMQYIEPKPRPEDPVVGMKKLATAIRNLHDKNSFEQWKTVVEVFESILQKLPSEYINKNIIKKCIEEIKIIKTFLFNQKDIRASHGDLNPVNILFDGENYVFVDWQAASPQSFYFDLAYCASFSYFHSEDLCMSFLKYYLEREATEEEEYKYYLMRVFTNIYLGIGFISLPLKSNQYFPVLLDYQIEKLPTFVQFMQSIGSGKTNLSDANVQQQVGFSLLKTAEAMMNNKYYQACQFLKNQSR